MNIRKSPIAGSWYKGTNTELTEQIQELFQNSVHGIQDDPFNSLKNTKIDDLLGIIVPHAGYMYSGSVATHGYHTLFKSIPHVDTVIVIGPNHRGVRTDISMYPEGKWVFPNGSVDIDHELVRFAKAYEFSDIHVDFDPISQSQEHSIDIQIPFLLYLFNQKFNIFPICLGSQSNQTTDALSKFLFDLIQTKKSKKIVIVASSDLSHEYNYDILIQNDTNFLELLLLGDVTSLEKFRLDHHMTSCGYGAIFTLIKLANSYTQPSIKLLKYANSSQITGKSGGYTVGYPCLSVTAIR
ncbi:MAG: AmmeMemoRadiSam system protein B [Candidatus Heimdallarchaeota archaeon]|nr:AmmeMemoRadiSam system protein B [Candidatus Heimdallarchaeota archaeon]MDH5647612.1 AmmeMemoRadiSam system protein B [Candidatus Heimdallarchaeota archaeon]